MKKRQEKLTALHGERQEFLKIHRQGGC
jgi:hypothetical protein